MGRPKPPHEPSLEANAPMAALLVPPEVPAAAPVGVLHLPLGELRDHARRQSETRRDARERRGDRCVPGPGRETDGERRAQEKLTKAHVRSLQARRAIEAMRPG